MLKTNGIIISMSGKAGSQQTPDIHCEQMIPPLCRHGGLRRNPDQTRQKPRHVVDRGLAEYAPRAHRCLGKVLGGFRPHENGPKNGTYVQFHLVKIAIHAY